jgi:glutamine synthetase
MKLVLEYVWIGGKQELHSKTRIIETETEQLSIKDIPLWNYDGSSTSQAEINNSDVILMPVALFRDPFRSNKNAFLVMCETKRNDGTVLENSYREWANNIFNKDLMQEPWFGIEQEYFFVDTTTRLPVGYKEDIIQDKKKIHYCGVGGEHIFGRDIVELHMNACLTAGITISGINAEVAPSQWEYQIGPCVGIHAGDHLWMSRYLLERVSERFGVSISWEPKPVSSINGSGCHVNYSTKLMREGHDKKSGLVYINEAVECLKNTHEEHMKVYGKDNEKRMTGKNETSNYTDFTYGYGSRNTSVRIGHDVVKHKKGYFEDRRPASNMDPYLVTAKIFETTCLKM